MKSLDELGLKWGTDKSSKYHNYLDFYQTHIPKNPKRVLEVGVWQGASLFMWAEWYPKAEVIGIDTRQPSGVEKEFEETGAQFIEMSGTDVYGLAQLGKFDLIIDDGSHTWLDQQIAFQYLFNNSLNEGGVFIMEDLHSSFWDDPDFTNAFNDTYSVLEALRMDDVIDIDYWQRDPSTRSDSFTAVIRKKK